MIGLVVEYIAVMLSWNRISTFSSNGVSEAHPRRYAKSTASEPLHGLLLATSQLFFQILSCRIAS